MHRFIIGHGFINCRTVCSVIVKVTVFQGLVDTSKILIDDPTRADCNMAYF